MLGIDTLSSLAPLEREVELLPLTDHYIECIAKYIQFPDYFGKNNGWFTYSWIILTGYI